MSRRTPPRRPAARRVPTVKRAEIDRVDEIMRARRAKRTPARTSPARTAPARRTVTMREPGRSASRRHVRRSADPIRRRVVSRRVAPPTTGRLSVGQSRYRLVAVLTLIALLLGAVLYRVGRLQVAGGEELRAAATEQWTRTRPLAADRGTIFDRNGEELAVSVPAYAVSVNPKLVTDESATAQLLQRTLALTDEQTAKLYDTLVAKTTGFAYVAHHVDLTTGDQLKKLGLTGVNVDPEDERILPGGTTGWSVIGKTDVFGVGTAGLELQYDEILTGTPGEMSREVAPAGRSIAGTERVTLEPVPGNDLILTLDRSIQFAAEQALLTRVSELAAKSGTIIVMDTDSGDIIAMASVQRDDENAVVVTSGNFAAVNAYEPGSVAKVITMAAGLNEGAVTPDSTFVVPWRRQYALDLLSDSHEHPDELMTVQQILVESSNIGTIDVQQATGREKHWEYMRQFGLGEKTALGFPGESAGILKDVDDLWGSERVTVAYGQGVASTSIQLATAINVIANDGTYVAPRLVSAYVDPNGEIIEAEASATHEVVRPAIAEQLQRMMRAVVCDPDGTGELAQRGIEHFSVAGKTGTGLKAQPNGTYYNEAGERVYYASFAGFFPAEDPQVTVLVSIDEPPAGDINRFGGQGAAPVFAQIAPTIVHELGIQPPADATPCAP